MEKKSNITEEEEASSAFEVNHILAELIKRVSLEDKRDNSAKKNASHNDTTTNESYNRKRNVIITRSKSSTSVPVIKDTINARKDLNAVENKKIDESMTRKSGRIMTRKDSKAIENKKSMKRSHLSIAEKNQRNPTSNAIANKRAGIKISSSMAKNNKKIPSNKAENDCTNLFTPETDEESYTFVVAIFRAKKKEKLYFNEVDYYIKKKYRANIPNLRKMINRGIKNDEIKKSKGSNKKLQYEFKETQQKKKSYKKKESPNSATKKKENQKKKKNSPKKKESPNVSTKKNNRTNPSSSSNKKAKPTAKATYKKKTSANRK